MPCRPLTTRPRQAGAALLVALLIMALASLLSLRINRQLSLDLARTQSLANDLRALEFAAGLEALAGKMLREDNEREGELDSRASPWAQDLPALPIPGGTASGRLASLDGRFNLNTLIRPDGTDDAQARQRLERLLSALGLPDLLADRIHDWIDSDTVPRPKGAEDQHYQALANPYLTANQPLADISELLLVAGIDRERYQRLLPHVAALPVRHRQINVNLATVPVLMSLNGAITEQIARDLHRNGRAAWRDVAAWMNQQALSGINLEPQRPVLKVTSHYFIAHMQVVLDGLPHRYRALLRRSGNSYAVLWRHAALP